MHIRDHRRSFSGWTDPCSLGHRPASFRLGDFRSVAALVPFAAFAQSVGGQVIQLSRCSCDSEESPNHRPNYNLVRPKTP